MKFNLPTINIGDTVKCLSCKSPIKLENKKTMFINLEGEFVYCPKCNTYCDIQYYYIHGEKI